MMIRLYDPLRGERAISFIGAPTILFTRLKFRLVFYLCLPTLSSLGWKDDTIRSYLR